MELKTERLSLQEITWDDLDDIHRFHLMPEVDMYNTLGIPESLEETREVMRGSIEDRENDIRKDYQWSIRGHGNESLIGLAGMRLAAERFKMAEIYYKITPAFWGDGFGTEVARALVAFGFDDLKLHRIEAGVHTDNTASIRVLEKIGMRREGKHRKILPIRGEWFDNYHYAILENDERL